MAQLHNVDKWLNYCYDEASYHPSSNAR